VNESRPNQKKNDATGSASGIFLHDRKHSPSQYRENEIESSLAIIDYNPGNGHFPNDDFSCQAESLTYDA
jgi:hypothetical protein